MDKYQEVIDLLNARLKLFDPEFDAVKFVPPRVLEEAKQFMEIAGMFPSDEEIKSDLRKGGRDGV